MKKAATAWIREHHDSEFSWQEGYAGFTVSPTARTGVKNYIANQVEHHRKRTFAEELKALLKQAKIPFDPKYLE